MLLIMLALVCFILLAVFFLTTPGSVPATSGTPSEGNPSQENDGADPKGPLLVVPENAIGTLGLMSALVFAFGIFVVAKRRK
jgi:hypothetical protein